MKNKLIKIIVFVLILVFYASLLTYKIELPVTDDMARHIKNGELILQGNFEVLYSNVYSYTEPGHPFINHHWLSGVVFYLLHQAIGWDGLVIFKIIVFLSSFGLLFITATKKADFWLVAFFSLPTIFILGERTSLRPEIFSYLFIAIFLYFLIDLEEHPERKRIYWLIPLELLWVNMHVFWSIGVMMVAGFLLEKIIRPLAPTAPSGQVGWRDPVVKKLTFLLAALALVSFINPNGASGVFYSYPRDFPIIIGENQSLSQLQRTMAPWADISVAIFEPTLFLLALSFFFGFRRRQKPWFYFLASAATAVLSFYMLRGISLFGLIFLPAVSANFNEVFIRLKAVFSKNSKRIFIAFFAPALLYLIFLGGSGRLSSYNKPGIGLTPQSQSSAEFFKAQNLKGPIFNDTDIGSYLIYHLYPQEKVFADNRFGDAYPASFFSDVYKPMLRDSGKWQEALQKYQFNTIFLYQYNLNPDVRSFIYQMAHDPEWALIYVDPYAVIFLRNNPANRATIDKFQITPKNAEEKLKFLLESQNFDGQVAAADTFSLLGRPDLEMKTFLQVVGRWPKKDKVWMVMGARESAKNPRLAITYLEKAIALERKTAETYSVLGAAYYNAGEYEKAKEAFRRALKINPERQDAKKLLESMD